MSSGVSCMSGKKFSQEGAGADEAKNSTGFTTYCFCAAIAASYATSEPVQCPKNATGF